MDIIYTNSSFCGSGKTFDATTAACHGITQNENTCIAVFYRIVNALAHKNVYYFEADLLVPDSLELFEAIFVKLNTQYAFVTHAG